MKRLHLAILLLVLSVVLQALVPFLDWTRAQTVIVALLSLVLAVLSLVAAFTLPKEE